MSNNQEQPEYGNAHADKSGIHPEVAKREHVIIERMKNLTEDQIIHALYVEADTLINLEKLGDNPDYKAKNEGLKINEK
jgi:hypothetical protein